MATRKDQVKTSQQAIVYLADCTLATVASMAMKKSRPVFEYKRQIQIAQSAVDFINLFLCDCDGTRAQTVKNLYGGNVRDWAKDREIN